jgi:catechol 2,3-dioxygenase-like lactoylglutathione lyase family enzyme
MRFNKLVPELAVSDFGKSLEFYTKALGFRVLFQREESCFAFLEFQGSQIMLEEMNGRWMTGKLERPFGRGINLQLEVRSIATIFSRLKRKKYPVMVKPHENCYRVGVKKLGFREFLVQDPDGYLLRFSEVVGKGV